MSQTMIVLAIGTLAGVMGGFFGVAGGVLIVPALVFVLAMPQQAAIGTSLAALLPPVGLLGTLRVLPARPGQLPVCDAFGRRINGRRLLRLHLRDQASGRNVAPRLRGFPYLDRRQNAHQINFVA